MNHSNAMARAPSLSTQRAAWIASVCLAGICLVFCSVSTVVGQDGWQWRVSKIDDGRLLLAFTESESTDDLGTYWFYCKPASNRIDVFVTAKEKERKILADFIRTDGYPKIQLEGEIALAQPSYSETGGWEYHFDIAADGAAFNKLRRTGRFGFKLGTFVADWGANPISKSGLDKVSEFQAACRKVGANTSHGRTKTQ